MLETVFRADGDPRPSLLFYCQHSLGIGHLTRSFALVAALTRHFRVTFLNGGRLPPGVPVPQGMHRIDLPPLGMDDGHTVVSRGAAHDVASARAERQRLIADAVANTQPAVLVVELFPFGRKKFAGEILPLLRAARRQPQPALVACSLRDILVNARPDQQHHDDRAAWLANRCFDLVLVHADPAFAQLSESFTPRRPLRVPVVHTGYVVPNRPDTAAPAAERGPHVLVSAGGGIVGEALFTAVLTAHRRLAAPPPLRIVAGPFLPEPAWVALQQQAAAQPGVAVVRHVPDMVAEMRTARCAISQCGYNTALDIVVAGVPALVLPYRTATENEQSDRAERLAALGAVQTLGDAPVTPATLAVALQRLLHFQPKPATLALDGAERSATLLVQHLAALRAQQAGVAAAARPNTLPHALPFSLAAAPAAPPAAQAALHTAHAALPAAHTHPRPSGPGLASPELPCTTR